MDKFTQPTIRSASRILGILEEFGKESIDIRDALLPFFKPLLAEKNGRHFSPKDLAYQVSQTYGWKMPESALREFIPIFERKGYLVKKDIGKNSNPLLYIKCEEAEKTEMETAEFEKGFSSISKRFKEFINQEPDLYINDYDEQQLGDLLAKCLVYLDIYTPSDIHKSSSLIGGEIVKNDQSPAVGPSERYWCMKFIKDLRQKGKISDIELLCRISIVGVLLEVVESFRKPTNPSERKNNRVYFYLDAPVALDLLGTSGLETKEATESVIQKIQSLGVFTRIFDVSCSEISRVLKAFLKTEVHERTGITAAAVRRGDIKEQAIREIQRYPEKFLNESGVKTVTGDLKLFPNRHRYFTAEQYDNLLSRISRDNLEAEEHDATVIALVTRMREKENIVNVFDSLGRKNHTFITGNFSFARLVREFCIEESLIKKNEHSLGPAVPFGHVALLTWLKTGLSARDIQEASKNRLLSACGKILANDGDAISGCMKIVKSQSPKKRMDSMKRLMERREIVTDIYHSTGAIDPKKRIGA